MCGCVSIIVTEALSAVSFLLLMSLFPLLNATFTMNDRRPWAIHARIFQSLWLITLFLIVGKSAVALKDITLAYRFGVSEMADIYLVVFMVIVWLPIAWSGVLNYAMTTATVGMPKQDKYRFYDELTGLTLWVALLFTIGLQLVVHYFNFMRPEDLSSEGGVRISHLFLGMAPVMFLHFVYARYSAQLLTLEKHGNTMLDAVPPIAVTLALLLGPQGSPVQSIVVASVIGGLVQVIGLLFLLQRNKISVGVSFSFKAKSWAAFKGAFFLLIAGQIILSFTSPIDLYFAGQLSEGNLANYGYTQRIVLLLFSFATIPIMRGFLPLLSQSKQSKAEIRQIVTYWSGGLLVISIIALVIGWIFAHTGVTLIYQRGAFDTGDTDIVAGALQIALLQLPFFFGAMVFVQYFASLNRYAVVFRGVLISVVVKVMSAGPLVEQYGLNGLMFSSALMYAASWLHFLYCFYVVGKQTQDLSRS